MAYQQLEYLPQEVIEKLLEHGQKLFMAAYNAVLDNAINKHNATKVALNSVKNSYKQDRDKNWLLIENSKADRENNAGTMRGG